MPLRRIHSLSLSMSFFLLLLAVVISRKKKKIPRKAELVPKHSGCGGTLGLRQWPASSMALETHHSSANWEQQEGCLCHRKRAGLVLPHSAPVKPLGLTPLVMATQGLQQQTSWAWGSPRLDLTVGYSSWKTRDLFFLALILWLCNALQADLDVHPFIINNQSYHVKIQKHSECRGSWMNRAPCQH